MKKRTCNKCKAQWYDAENNQAICVLKYDCVENDKGYLIPNVNCPKPKTKEQLQHLMQVTLLI